MKDPLAATAFVTATLPAPLVQAAQPSVASVEELLWLTQAAMQKAVADIKAAK